MRLLVRTAKALERGPTLLLPEPAAELAKLMRRYDPGARERRTGVQLSSDITVTGPIELTQRLADRLGITWVPAVLYTVQDGKTGSDQALLARALHHYLGGTWVVPPPAAGEEDEPINDLVRVYAPGALLPADLAELLKKFLPNVAIREDPDLRLFWFDDTDSELTISAAPADQSRLPLAAREQLSTAKELYECGIDDVVGPTPQTADQAGRIALHLAETLNGIPVDRYGFRVATANDLLPRGVTG